MWPGAVRPELRTQPSIKGGCVMQSARPAIRAAGRAIRAAATRHGPIITVVVVLALLASGCAGHKTPPAAVNRHPTASPSPTATPMTATEREWVAGIAQL